MAKNLFQLFPQKTAPKTPLGYKMVAKDKKGEIYLYGNIGMSFWGDGISAKQFKDDLKALGDVTTLDVRINSDGGDVFEGRTMYSLLSEHPAKKTVYVDGLAASIASLIAMAGNEIKMADGSFMMIHNAWGVAVGDSNEMNRMATLLESVTGTLIDTYAARTGQDRSKIKKWMNDETWMEAKDAKERGFATTVIEPVKAAASVRYPELFKNLPAPLRPNRTSAMAIIDRMRGKLTPSGKKV